MKWIDRLTECVDYIENNLKGKIDMNRLSEISCLSNFYFPRLFEAVADISLSEYIRRRRMTLAAKELLSGSKKIIDIAFDFDYSTPESFSRAFKSVHGISPSRLRRDNPTIKSYPKLIFTISIKGDSEMDYKIIDKEEFKVLGVSITATDVEGEDSTDIPKFWHRINTDGTIKKLYQLSSKCNEMYGICFDIKEERTFKYLAAVPYAGGDTGEFEIMTIPNTKWAIFESIGPMPSALQKVWRRIFTEWLPATEYEIASLPQIEFYYPGNSSDSNYKSEVWIPIN